jgi:hypothetical protein
LLSEPGKYLKERYICETSRLFFMSPLVISSPLPSTPHGAFFPLLLRSVYCTRFLFHHGSISLILAICTLQQISILTQLWCPGGTAHRLEVLLLLRQVRHPYRLPLPAPLSNFPLHTPSIPIPPPPPPPRCPELPSLVFSFLMSFILCVLLPLHPPPFSSPRYFVSPLFLFPRRLPRRPPPVLPHRSSPPTPPKRRAPLPSPIRHLSATYPSTQEVFGPRMRCCVLVNLRPKHAFSASYGDLSLTNVRGLTSFTSSLGVQIAPRLDVPPLKLCPVHPRTGGAVQYMYCPVSVSNALSTLAAAALLLPYI